MPIDDALGTIGGDDTIFIAFRTPAAAAAFARRVHEIAGIPRRLRAATYTRIAPAFVLVRGLP